MRARQRLMPRKESVLDSERGPASEPLAGFSLVLGAQTARVRRGREGLGQTWEATARAKGSHSQGWEPHTIIPRSTTEPGHSGVDEQLQTGPRPAPRSPTLLQPSASGPGRPPCQGVLRAGVSRESWR